MEAFSVKIEGIGAPTEACECGTFDWRKTQPGDLHGYRCSGCNKLGWGEITFGDPETVELDVWAEKHPDGSATIHMEGRDDDER